MSGRAEACLRPPPFRCQLSNILHRGTPVLDTIRSVAALTSSSSMETHTRATRDDTYPLP